MPTIASLLQDILAFRDARDWKQFHNPKDLAIGLNIEAGELLELYLWKHPDQADPAKAAEEIADVLIYALLLADAYGFDPATLVRDKLARNNRNYPVDKAKGSAKKYTEL